MLTFYTFPAFYCLNILEWSVFKVMHCSEILCTFSTFVLIHRTKNRVGMAGCIFFTNGGDWLHDDFISFRAEYFFEEEMVGYPKMIFFSYMRQQFNILVLLPLEPTHRFLRDALTGLFFGLVIGKIFFFILEFH